MTVFLVLHAVLTALAVLREVRRPGAERATLGLLAVWLVLLLCAGDLVRSVYALSALVLGWPGPGIVEAIWRAVRRTGPSPRSRQVLRATCLAVPYLVCLATAAWPQFAEWTRTWDAHALPVVQRAALSCAPWCTLAHASLVVVGTLTRLDSVRRACAAADAWLFSAIAERTDAGILRRCLEFVSTRFHADESRHLVLRGVAAADVERLRRAVGIGWRARAALDDERVLRARMREFAARRLDVERIKDRSDGEIAAATATLTVVRSVADDVERTVPATLRERRPAHGAHDPEFLAKCVEVVALWRLLAASAPLVRTEEAVAAALDDVGNAHDGEAGAVVTASKWLFDVSTGRRSEPVHVETVHVERLAAVVTYDVEPLLRTVAALAEGKQLPWAALVALRRACGTRAARRPEAWAASTARLLDAEARRRVAVEAVAGAYGRVAAARALSRSRERAARFAWVCGEARGDPIACREPFLVMASDGTRRFFHPQRGLAAVPRPRVAAPDGERLRSGILAAFSARRPGSAGFALLASALSVTAWSVIATEPSPGDLVRVQDLRLSRGPSPYDDVRAVTWDSGTRTWVVGGSNGAVAAFDPAERLARDLVPALGGHEDAGPVRALAFAGDALWIARGGGLVRRTRDGERTFVGEAAPQIPDGAAIASAVLRGNHWLLAFDGSAIGLYGPETRSWGWALRTSDLVGTRVTSLRAARTVFATLGDRGIAVFAAADETASPRLIWSAVPPDGAKLMDVADTGEALMDLAGGRVEIWGAGGSRRVLARGGEAPSLTGAEVVFPAADWWLVARPDTGGGWDLVGAYAPASRWWWSAAAAPPPLHWTVPPALSGGVVAMAQGRDVAVGRRRGDSPEPVIVRQIRFEAAPSSMAWLGEDLELRLEDGRSAVVVRAAGPEEPVVSYRGIAASGPPDWSPVHLAAFADGTTLLADVTGRLRVHDEAEGVWLDPTARGWPATGIVQLGGRGDTLYAALADGSVLELAAGGGARPWEPGDAPSLSDARAITADSAGLHVVDASGHRWRYGTATMQWTRVEAHAEVPAANLFVHEAVELVDRDGDVVLLVEGAEAARIPAARRCWVWSAGGPLLGVASAGALRVVGPDGTQRPSPAGAVEVEALGHGWFASRSHGLDWIAGPQTGGPLRPGPKGFAADVVDRVFASGAGLVVRTADGWFETAAARAPRLRIAAPGSGEMVQGPDGPLGVRAEVPVSLVRTPRWQWTWDGAQLASASPQGARRRRLGPDGFDDERLAEVVVAEGTAYRAGGGFIVSRAPVAASTAAEARVLVQGDVSRPARLVVDGREFGLGREGLREVESDARGIHHTAFRRSRHGTAPEMAGRAGVQAFSPGDRGGFARDLVLDGVLCGSVVVLETAGGIEIERGGRLVDAVEPPATARRPVVARSDRAAYCVTTGGVETFPCEAGDSSGAAEAEEALAARRRAEVEPLRGLGWTLSRRADAWAFVAEGSGGREIRRGFRDGRFDDDDVLDIESDGVRASVVLRQVPLVPFDAAVDTSDRLEPSPEPIRVGWPARRAGTLVFAADDSAQAGVEDRILRTPAGRGR